MMSMNGSIVTFLFGSNEYRSLTVTSRGNSYHLWLVKHCTSAPGTALVLNLAEGRDVRFRRSLAELLVGIEPQRLMILDGKRGFL